MEYGISLSIGHRWYSNLGIRRQRAHYDGAPEHATFFVAGIEGRL
jgi:hypothetical protein